MVEFRSVDHALAVRVASLTNFQQCYLVSPKAPTIALMICDWSLPIEIFNSYWFELLDVHIDQVWSILIMIVTPVFAGSVVKVNSFFTNHPSMYWHMNHTQCLKYYVKWITTHKYTTHNFLWSQLSIKWSDIRTILKDAILAKLPWFSIHNDKVHAIF